jgi:hypothetical protein
LVSANISEGLLQSFIVFGAVIIFWHVPYYLGIIQFTMLEILLISTFGVWILHFYEQTIQVVQGILSEEAEKHTETAETA